MSRQSRLPRFIHCILAHGRGYFWLPCPICGRKFGGHEYNSIYLKVGPNTGKSICRDPACAVEARRRNVIEPVWQRQNCTIQQNERRITRPKAPENVTLKSCYCQPPIPHIEMIKMGRKGNE